MRCVIALTTLMGFLGVEAEAGFIILVANEPTGIISQVDQNGQVTTFASQPGDRYTGLAFDAAGNLYAASNGNDIIARYSPAGTPLGPFVSSGLSWPGGIVFDSGGNLYVANATGSQDISKFSPTGAPLGTFLSGTQADHLAISPTGDFYASSSIDALNVARYSSDGTFLNYVAQGLGGPDFMAFDSSGNVYVSCFYSDTVEVFTPSGIHLATYASAGLDGPTGLAFDPSGNLYVANALNGSIRKFSSAGQDLGSFATGLTGPQGLVIQVNEVPEPSSLTLFGIGTLALGFVARRRRRFA